MPFLNPMALVYLALIPIIILLYLLKLKRDSYNVPSLLLWEQTVRDLEAQTPFQKLRTNLLLILQIIILLAIIFALTRPFLRVSSVAGERTIIILDNSASMQATDENPNRFQRAKHIASDLIKKMGTGDQIMLLTSSSRTYVITGFSADKGHLLKMLNKVQVNDTGTNLREGLLTSISLLQSYKNGSIVLISDGSTESLEELYAENLNINFIKVGKENQNVGIIALDVRRSGGGSVYQVFCAMENYGDELANVDLEFYVDDVLTDVMPLKLEAHKRYAHLFENLNYNMEKVAQIKLQLNTDNDLLKSDNSAYAILPKMNPLKILLVSDGNYFLERVLNLDERVELYLLKPQEYKPNDEFDLYVFDNFSPKVLPERNCVFFNALPPSKEFKEEGYEKIPTITNWENSHPILNYVDLSNIQLAKARKVSVSKYVETIAETNGLPLICISKIGGQNIIYIGFDLYDSNFPLRAGFPIFISNILNYLSGSSNAFSSPQIKTGSLYPIYFDEIPETFFIITPSNKKIPIKTDRSPYYFAATETNGWYKIVMDDEETYFAANLLNERESNITPQKQLSIGNEILIGDKSTIKTNREIWTWLAILAILVLIAEWFVYHRRFLL